MSPPTVRPHLLLALLSLLLTACGGPAKAPEPADPQLVTLEGAIANGYVLAETAGPVVARIRIGTRAPADRPRGPANLALVIDTSGSMEGQQIKDAREASLAMIDALQVGDRLAVVLFHSKAEVLLPSTVLDEDSRAEVKAKIASMKAHGTTDMASGLRRGLDEVKAHLDPNGINRVVLLGDGEPNEEAPIRPLAQEAGSSGVSITALGLGADYNEGLMGAIAQLSGGRFRYVEDSTKVATFLKEEILRLQGVYAKNAVVQLTTGPGVRIESVVGQTVERTATGARVSIGDISKNDTRDLVVRLSAEGRKAGVVVELLDAVMTFDDATGSGGRLERRVFLGARSTADEQEIAKGRDRSVDLTAALVQAAAITVEALEAARNGEFVRARAALERGAEEALAQLKLTPSAELEKQAQTMRALASDMPKADRPRAAAMHAPAPAPAELAYESPSPGGGAIAAPVAPKRVRAAHDEAMRQLQNANPADH